VSEPGGSRRGALLVVSVLGAYLALSVIGLVLMVSGGLGPDVEATLTNRIGMAMLKPLFFPLDVIHARFFHGRQLPGNDWLWIAGVGACYAGGASSVFTLWKRARRR
jgi:hypothetical protein